MNLFFKNVTVLIADDVADANGNIYDIDKVTLNGNVVPVLYRFNEDIVVGEAWLKIVGNEIHADFKLNSNMLEEVDARLVPCIGGMVIASEDKPKGVEQMIMINNIGLSKENVDKRIKPLLG